MIDLLASDPVMLGTLAVVAWLALAVTSIRRARNGGES